MEKGTTFKVLDHGYLKLIDWMGTEESIIEAARMSTGKGFEGWDPHERCKVCNATKRSSDGALGVDVFSPVRICNREDHNWEKRPGDQKLLHTLYTQGHMTPFEMCELLIEIQAPIMVFREWHRHRTQCLSGDTRVTFELPVRSRKGKKGPYRLTMEQLWKRLLSAEKAVRVQGMLLRVLNEDTGEFTTSRVLEVVRSPAKPLYRVTTAGGKSIKASADHRFFTNAGWEALKDMAKLPTVEDSTWKAFSFVTVGTTERKKAQSWDPPSFSPTEEEWRKVIGFGENYSVSNMGRVRRDNRGQGAQVGKIKEPSVARSGYPVVSLSHEGKTYVCTVHRLVLSAFAGSSSQGLETRHLNHNRLDCRLSNLAWGSSKDNSSDMQAADRQQRLVAGHEEITCIELIDSEVTYDLVVDGPWHNFVAEGIVVHNSYNEFSARYAQMPNLHYLPDPSRIQKQSTANKQGSAEALPEDEAKEVVGRLGSEQQYVYDHYEMLVDNGVAKEVARLNTPVSRYSKMRAKMNLRNFLGFLLLRKKPSAQYEIRQYADVGGEIVQALWPRTWALFMEHTFDAVRLSATEAMAIRVSLEAARGTGVDFNLGDALEKKLGVVR